MMEISVRLLSGTMIMQKKFPHKAIVSEVRAELHKVEKTDNILKLFFDGVEIRDTTLLSDLGIKRGDVINLVREPKPKPKAPPPPPRRVSSSPSRSD